MPWEDTASRIIAPEPEGCLLWLTFLPTVSALIPEDKQLPSNSHPNPDTKMKQALSQSPERGENINWAEIQNAQGGEEAMKYQ